jgi:phage shock protein PspC (stress-responsive transcriptional regulator)
MTDDAAEPRRPAGPSPDTPAPSPTDVPPAQAEPRAAGDEPTLIDRPADQPTAADEPTLIHGPAHQPTAADEPTLIDRPADQPTAANEPTLIHGPAAEAAGGPTRVGDPAVDDEPPGAGAAPPPGAGAPPPPPPPPGAGEVPPAGPPPWFGPGGTFSRGKLVRPAHGRYIAGVCGALGRATNTDPVLWRVLLAVLGFFGGVGVLIYLIGWLAIPSEGNPASPIESLVGRGRSGMSPAAVVALAAAAVLTFAFIVHDGFRATLLAAAVIVGAALLLKRNGWPGPNAGPAPATGATTTTPGADDPTAVFATPGPTTTAAGTGGGSAAPPPGNPATEPPPPMPPVPAGNVPPGYAPPAGGYRPPFAPHGPWAGAPQSPDAASWPQPRPPAPPKPARERSKLGRITFFTMLFVLGVLALVDVAGVGLPVSAYFAGALATIAAGLIVGAWIGRARGLIFLALLATVGLAISSGTERWGDVVENRVLHPQTRAAVAPRYDFGVGNTTLDLTDVDFTTGAMQDTRINMQAGQLRVLLPPNVDTTATVDLGRGRLQAFGREWTGNNIGSQTVTDAGADGAASGGTLRLTIDMNAGNVEVIR